MMHNTCIAAFRTQTRRRHQLASGVIPKPATFTMPRLTALVEQDIHQCVQRRANEARIPAFYTLCGYLVPSANVEQTCGTVTCRRCLRRANETDL